MFDDPCLSVHDFKGSHSNVQELTLSTAGLAIRHSDGGLAFSTDIPTFQPYIYFFGLITSPSLVSLAI